MRRRYATGSRAAAKSKNDVGSVVVFSASDDVRLSSDLGRLARRSAVRSVGPFAVCDFFRCDGGECGVVREQFVMGTVSIRQANKQQRNL